MKKKRIISFDKAIIAFTVCIVGSFILPYQMKPFLNFYQEWVSILGVMLIFLFCIEEYQGRFVIPSTVVLPIFIACLIAIQCIFRMLTDPWDAALPIAYLISSALAMIIAATICQSASDTYKFTNSVTFALVLAATISVVIATCQLLGMEHNLGNFAMQMPHEGISIRPYANLGQPNQLALLICMGIAATWWRYQATTVNFLSALILTIFLVWGLAMTQSRFAWIAIPLFCIATWRWRADPDSRRVSIPCLAVMLLCYLLFAVAQPIIGNMLGEGNSDGGLRAASALQRISLYKQAWYIGTNHPWFGTGWFGFGAEQTRTAADLGPSVYATHSHNILLNFFAELGFPAAVLIFGTIIMWGIAAFSRRRASKEVQFAALFFLAVGVHSMVEYPLWYGYVLMPTALLVGMVHQQQIGSRHFHCSVGLISSAAFIMMIGLIGTALDYRRLVIDFRAFGFSTLGLAADEGSTEKPMLTIFPQFYDYFRFAKTPAHGGMTLTEILFMEHVATQFGNPPVMMRMSLVYALNGRPDDAVRVVKTIKRLHSLHYLQVYQNWRAISTLKPEFAAVFYQIEQP